MRNHVPNMLLGSLCLALSALAHAQIAVSPINGTTVTKDTLAASLLGANSGITITDVTYAGANIATGEFSGGTNILGIASGIVLTSGSVNNVVGPNSSDGETTDNGLPGDAQLTVLAGAPTEDASVLTITFVPTGTTLQFSYVFGSEEYPEFVDSEFNDVFALFVNGTNRAIIPNTALPVAINNLNCGDENGAGARPNCTLYVNNHFPGTINTQLDGFTKVLTLTAPVNPGVPNTLKLAIADTSDGILDSAVFIAGGSLTSCGGPSQPPCVTTPPVPGPAASIPTLGEWSLLLLAMCAGLIGMNALRNRG